MKFGTWCFFGAWRLGFGVFSLARFGGGDFLFHFLFPFFAEVLHGMARALAPEVLGVLALTQSGVELRHEVPIVLFRHPIEKIGADSITRVIARPRNIPLGDFRSMRLGLELEPADIIGDSLGQPSRGACGIRIGAARAAILLDDV